MQCSSHISLGTSKWQQAFIAASVGKFEEFATTALPGAGSKIIGATCAEMAGSEQRSRYSPLAAAV